MKMCRWFCAVAVLIVAGRSALLADQPAPLPADQLDTIHRLIKPRAGESRWMEIDWHPSVWEGRKKAAKEGKPLFIWAGSGGAPAAGC